MSNVLIELEKSDSTTEYIKSSLKLLFKECNIQTRVKLLTEISAKDLNWCDVYLAVRPFTLLSLTIAKIIKKTNRFYIVMYDDDLVNYDGALPWRIDCAKKCINLSEIVLSPNQLIAQEYAKFNSNKRFVLLNTPVDKSEINCKKYRNEKISFIYAAGKDHAEIFEKQIKPILNDFLKVYSSRVHFTFVGVVPDLSDIGFEENFTFVPLLKLAEYNVYMKSNNFDIGLAPLDDTYFANRKYFNKYIEYTKFGILGSYSNVLPYTLAVKDRKNGILVENTYEGWYQALCFCVDNFDKCERYLKVAQQDLELNFSVKKIANTIKKEITEFEHYTSKKDSISWKRTLIKHYFFLLMDKFYKILYSLKHKGIRYTFVMIKSYFENSNKIGR